jgi:quercetin dioxygenase-like cupin family protein
VNSVVDKMQEGTQIMERQILGMHTLVTEIERFDPEESKSGRRSETLVKTNDLRVVLVTMEKNALLRNHSAPGTVTIQCLLGQFAVQVDNDDIILESGALLTLAAGVEHAVRAHATGAFLLTIGWSKNAPEPDHL